MLARVVVHKRSLLHVAARRLSFVLSLAESASPGLGYNANDHHEKSPPGRHCYDFLPRALKRIASHLKECDECQRTVYRLSIGSVVFMSVYQPTVRAFT